MHNNIIMTPKHKIGLSLSGGGAKGIAHVGLLKALHEHELQPEILSGVSAGALVGALYADGKSPEEILGFFKEAKFFKYVNIAIPKMGIMSSERFEKILNDYMFAKTFEELKIPLFVNATELIEGKNIYFSKGELIDRLVASASVPIFLKPKIIGKKIYVDGGVFNNMPCSIIRDKCKMLIGCHVSPIRKQMDIDGVLDVAERVYDLTIQASAVQEKKLCDIIIEPENVKDFRMFDTSNTQKIYDFGYSKAMRVLDEKRDIIELLLKD